MSNLDKKQLEEMTEALNSTEKNVEEWKKEYGTTDLYKEGVSENDYVQAKLYGSRGSIYGTDVSLLKVQIYELIKKENINIKEKKSTCFIL